MMELSSWILLLKDLAILSAVIWFCLKVFGIEARQWRDVTMFGSAALFCLAVATALVWFLDSPPSWKAFYFVESSWTLSGDITVLFISAGFGFGLVFICRLWRKLAHN